MRAVIANHGEARSQAFRERLSGQLKTALRSKALQIEDDLERNHLAPVTAAEKYQEQVSRDASGGPSGALFLENPKWLKEKCGA